mmetsp:Transcript_27070/g.45336  ORF Transcript_27070/g.45336 Transcript_27070/m.45336 type:complete len:292 (-) Transcript_27070:811-1686(-)
MSYSKLINNNNNKKQQPKRWNTQNGSNKRSIIDSIMGKVKDGGTSYLWESGLQPHHWMIRKASIISRFSGKGVWHYVDPTAGQSNNQPAGTITEVENIADTEVINTTEATNTEIAQRKRRQKVYREKQIAKINQNQNIPQETKLKEIAKINNKYAETIVTINQSRLDIQHKYTTIVAAQKRDIKEYKDDVSAVKEVFVKTFDSVTMNSIYKDLMDHKFRKIWKNLEDQFENHITKGSATQNALDNVYYNFVYEPQHSVEHNINFIETLGAALNKKYYSRCSKTVVYPSRQN